MLSEEASRDKNMKEMGKRLLLRGFKGVPLVDADKLMWRGWLPPLRRRRRQSPCSRARIQECEDDSQHQQGSVPDRSSRMLMLSVCK